MEPRANPKDWQHVKEGGELYTNDGIRNAEVHWMQREGFGRHDLFVKNGEIDCMKVKYIGTHETPAIDRDKIYEVISVEKGWYRIMTELEEDYLFPPKMFEIINE